MRRAKRKRLARERRKHRRFVEAERFWWKLAEIRAWLRIIWDAHHGDQDEARRGMWRLLNAADRSGT